MKKRAAAGAGRKRRAGKTKKRPAGWRVYVLRCADDTLYCGITNDMERRLAQHNAGTAARYTRGRGPVVVVCTWVCVDRSAALKEEHAFKKLSRLQKLSLIAARSVRRAR